LLVIVIRFEATLSTRLKNFRDSTVLLSKRRCQTPRPLKNLLRLRKQAQGDSLGGVRVPDLKYCFRKIWVYLSISQIDG
jgi:hypothetical protein